MFRSLKKKTTLMDQAIKLINHLRKKALPNITKETTKEIMGANHTAIKTLNHCKLLIMSRSKHRFNDLRIRLFIDLSPKLVTFLSLSVVRQPTKRYI